MIHRELTGKIIGCAMKVHQYFKNGYQEVIYQRALAIELDKAGISYMREYEIPIYYYDTKVGSRNIDFWIEGIIPVEKKAYSELEAMHFAQAFNYLEICKVECALLINFGESSLKFHRLTNKKLNDH